MREYLLLLPIIFIFHDMEEIIGFGWFFRNNPDIFKRFPIITKAYKDYTTAGMALAVYEEFIPFFAYRTEHLYKEVHSILDHKHHLPACNSNHFNKKFTIYCF